MLDGRGVGAVPEDALQRRVLAILRDVAGSGQVELDPDVPLYSSGLLDSLATVTLMAAFAEQLGVDISPAEFDAEAWGTPRRMAADVAARARGGRPA